MKVESSLFRKEKKQDFYYKFFNILKKNKTILKATLSTSKEQAFTKYMSKPH